MFKICHYYDQMIQCKYPLYNIWKVYNKHLIKILFYVWVCLLSKNIAGLEPENAVSGLKVECKDFCLHTNDPNEPNFVSKVYFKHSKVSFSLHICTYQSFNYHIKNTDNYACKSSKVLLNVYPEETHAGKI